MARVKICGLALVMAMPGAVGRASAATFVSDTYVGSQTGRFSYDGRWTHVRHITDGRLFGTSSRTSDPHAEVSLSFVGRVVRVYGVRGRGGGYGTVSIDGKRYPDIDFNAIHKIPRAVIFSSPILAQGLHQLLIDALPDRRALGDVRFINISGAVYQ